MKKMKHSSLKQKGSFRNMGIGARLSAVIGGTILVCLIVMTVIVTTVASNAIGKITESEMYSISEGNGVRIRSVIDVTNSIRQQMKNALKEMYETPDVDQTEEGGHLFTSRVTGDPISEGRYEAEKIMINTMNSVISASDENYIYGMGVFFEPNAFSAGSSKYALYVDRNDYANKTVQNLDYSEYSQKDYYTTPQKTGNFGTTKIYEDSNGVKMFTIFYPFNDASGKFAGIVMMDIDANVFDKLEAENENYPSMYANVINEDMNILFSTHTNVIGKDFKDTVSEDAFAKISEGMKTGKRFNVTTSSSSGTVMRYYAPIDMGNITFWVQTALPLSEYNATMNRLRTIILCVSAVIVILLIVLAYRFISLALKPLNTISDVAEKVSKGIFNLDINYDRDDEIGKAISALRNVVTRIRGIVTDLNEKLNEVAKGNFALDLNDNGTYIGEFAPLLDALNTITDDLNQTMVEIKSASGQVNNGAEQVSDGAQALAQGATEQASSVEELSATMNEISTKVSETAEKAKNAMELSKRAGSSMEISNAKMGEMSDAMADIIQKSEEIGKIIKTIDDIAFQTNILSLNAAIEAARAGSAGKGFAVVADEVGNLAKKSQEAAQNTAVLIEQTVESVHRGGEITRETAESLDSVAESSRQITSLVEEISEASNEQAKGVSQVSLGIDQISSVVQTNSATAEESAAASEELSSQANIMNGLVARFTLKTGTGSFSKKPAAKTIDMSPAPKTIDMNPAPKQAESAPKTDSFKSSTSAPKPSFTASSGAPKTSSVSKPASTPKPAPVMTPAPVDDIDYDNLDFHELDGKNLWDESYTQTNGADKY
ncbi:methyl-accepting chemotaxis protein [[Clostridium] aminophilum]|uniref:Methyl-accepting chemotaxis protein n=1 Tax=[Clostridium] aminophilum TaxID=1526 RepID=A0A1I0HTI5_9FIRM|nr:methyl-accepting chemotaxis protein [[Clostridium] aminophilum]SET87349.1 methyl-accepting chemotaxis protein [[Clostridium] aminophilum]